MARDRYIDFYRMSQGYPDLLDRIREEKGKGKTAQEIYEILKRSFGHRNAVPMIIDSEVPLTADEVNYIMSTGKTEEQTSGRSGEDPAVK